jgi:hypothetical protein
MMIAILELDFFHIEDLDFHNLAVKKASSLLLIPLEYFYQITCKAIYHITTAFKAKVLLS